MNLLITGANGFLGSHLCSYFSSQESYNVWAQTRKQPIQSKRSIKAIVFDLNDDLEHIDLSQVDIIVHCAGRAHVMNETEPSPLDAYRQINVKGALNLARKAAQSGVKRFIYLSSIKVNGEEATQQTPFTADDQIRTDDPYGLSKYEAEQALMKLADETGLEVVIIRPVLIYGPNVKANFKSMVSLSTKKIPLPIGCLDNKRSMVSVYNLADLIHVCMTHPNAVGQVFLASDQDDISVKQLFEKLAFLQNNKLIVVPIPKYLICFLAGLIGRSAMASRLCSELVVDSSKNTQVLGWKAPYSTEQSLIKMFREM